MKWMRLGFIMIGLSICFVGLVAQESTESEVLTQSVEKEFLIVKTTTSYEEAKKFVDTFSKKSAVTINLRTLEYKNNIGLTPAKEVCMESGFSYPCYVPRGRYDDGSYLSIEYSNSYEGFAEGYFMVIAASGEVDKTLFLKIKHLIPDAYIKKSLIYMGCIH